MPRAIDRTKKQKARPDGSGLASIPAAAAQAVTLASAALKIRLGRITALSFSLSTR